MKWIVKLIISLGLSSTALAGSARDSKARCGHENGQWDPEVQCCYSNSEELFCLQIDKEKSDATDDRKLDQAAEKFTE